MHNNRYISSKLRLPCIDVIRIDVEGAGAEIIKGAIKTIIKCKPVIFFEVHNKAERLAIKELKNLDYTAIERFGDMHILIPYLISGH